MILNDILSSLKSKKIHPINLWNSDSLIFIILQNLTDSFYKLNSNEFNDEEIEKVKTCIDILTNMINYFDDNTNNNTNNNINNNTNDVDKIVEGFLKMQLDYYIYPFLISSTDELLKISSLELFHSIFLHNSCSGFNNNSGFNSNVNNSSNINSGFNTSNINTTTNSNTSNINTTTNSNTSNINTTTNSNINNINNSELLPIILKIINSNSEKSQLLSLKILDLILMGNGLDYAVQTLDRFQAIDVVLNSLMKKSVLNKNIPFIKILLKIYQRMCDKNNVKIKLREKLPEGVEFKEMNELCEKDEELDNLRGRLIKKVQN